jgi:hypothetical protein
MTMFMRTRLSSAAFLLSAVALLACRPPAATSEPAPVEPPPPLIDTTSSAPGVWPDEPFRATGAGTGRDRRAQDPRGGETFKLDNGLEVHLVRQDKLPTVTMSFAFDFGAVSDPKNQTGLTSICMDLLDEGTKKYETAAFEEKQADHAVNVSSFGGSETAGINVRALRSQLGPALDLMAEMLQEPGMRQTDLDRLKDRRKANAAAGQGEPGERSPGAVLDARVGRGSPVRPHRDRGEHRRGRAEGLREGDRQAEAGRRAPVGHGHDRRGRAAPGARQRACRSGAARPRRAPKIAAAKPRLGTVFFVHVKDAAQSSIYVGHPGPRRARPRLRGDRPDDWRSSAARSPAAST